MKREQFTRPSRHSHTDSGALGLRRALYRHDLTRIIGLYVYGMWHVPIGHNNEFLRPPGCIPAPWAECALLQRVKARRSSGGMNETEIVVVGTIWWLNQEPKDDPWFSFFAQVTLLLKSQTLFLGLERVGY